jgi:hypothetical protein
MTFFLQGDLFLKIGFADAVSFFFVPFFHSEFFIGCQVKIFVLCIRRDAMRTSDHTKNLRARNKQHIFLIKYAGKGGSVGPTAPCKTVCRVKKEVGKENFF